MLKIVSQEGHLVAFYNLDHFTNCSIGYWILNSLSASDIEFSTVKIFVFGVFM